MHPRSSASFALEEISFDDLDAVVGGLAPSGAVSSESSTYNWYGRTYNQTTYHMPDGSTVVDRPGTLWSDQTHSRSDGSSSTTYSTGGQLGNDTLNGGGNLSITNHYGADGSYNGSNAHGDINAHLNTENLKINGSGQADGALVRNEDGSLTGSGTATGQADLHGQYGGHTLDGNLSGRVAGEGTLGTDGNFSGKGEYGWQGSGNANIGGERLGVAYENHGSADTDGNLSHGSSGSLDYQGRLGEFNAHGGYGIDRNAENGTISGQGAGSLSGNLGGHAFEGQVEGQGSITKGDDGVSFKGEGSTSGSLDGHVFGADGHVEGGLTYGPDGASAGITGGGNGYLDHYGAGGEFNAQAGVGWDGVSANGGADGYVTNDLSAEAPYDPGAVETAAYEPSADASYETAAVDTSYDAGTYDAGSNDAYAVA